MKKLFTKFQTILGTIFCLWFLLVIIKWFGFDFGVSLAVYFRIFLLLFLVWLTWITIINWLTIHSAIIRIWSKIKKNFNTETKESHKQLARIYFPWWLAKKVVMEILLTKITLFIITITVILIDIFVISFTSDIVIFILTAMWVWLVWVFKFEGRVSIVGALVFLSFCPFLIIFDEEPMAEKAAIWAYMFLVIGVLRMVWEEIHPNNKYLQIEELLPTIRLIQSRLRIWIQRRYEIELAKEKTH